MRGMELCVLETHRRGMMASLPEVTRVKLPLSKAHPSL